MLVPIPCPGLGCVILIIVHLLFLTISVLYTRQHSTQNQDKTLLILAALSKASAHVLSVDLFFLLISVCCDLAQSLRETLAAPLKCLGSVLQFRKLLCWCFFPFSILHIALSWATLGLASTREASGFTAYLYANLGTADGFFGHLLFLLLLVLVSNLKVVSTSPIQPISGYFVAPFLLAWSFHVSFCQSSTLQFINTPIATWLCSLCGVLIYSLQVLYRERKATARCAQTVFKIIEHPGQVVELRMSKDKFAPKIGQVCCVLRLLVHD